MSKLENRCFFRQNDGTYCKNGFLVKDHIEPSWTNLPSDREGFELVRTEPVQIEGTIIKCPICEEGLIITPDGKEILEFMKKHLRPVVQGLIEELTQ